MTHIFDMQVGKVQIPVEMPEWEERYPVPGPDSMKILKIVGAWRDGDRKSAPEEMPRELVAKNSRASWPDAFTGVNGIRVVSQGAKDVIEHFDPDLHQFFPVKLLSKGGAEIEGPWFTMNVTQRQDSIDMDRSRYHRSERRPDKLNGFLVNSTGKDVVINTSRLDPDIHFWREARFNRSLLGSDAFVAALKEAGLQFFPSYRATDG